GLAVQALTIFDGQHLRRVDEDRNPAEVLVTARCRDDFETVDPLHDEVENDQVRLVAQGLLDPGSGVVDGTHADVEGLEDRLDQADRLQVVIDDQDVGRHLLRALAIRHQVKADHQLDQLLPVDRLCQNVNVGDRDRRAVDGSHDHQRDVSGTRILAQFLDERRSAAEWQGGGGQEGGGRQGGRLLPG